MSLIDSLATTDELAAVFSDASVIAAMLEFERALAVAQARLGILPPVEFPSAGFFDAAAIARDARQSGTIAIPFVKALRSRVPEAHWGATSQDLIDTALVLLLGRAREIFARDHEDVARALRALSDKHAGTVMLARTLLQPAPPTTFGYKAALWRGALHRSWRRLSQSFDEALQLQFGGASGTLAAFGDRGPELAIELGKELRLPVPGAPWHAQRDRLAALVAHCGIYTGALAKIARDIALLMQPEIGELAERGGGSSSMPHKRNPSGSVTALAAAGRVPGLVASYLSAMPQEHERAAGGWQSEWPIVADVVQSTGSALAALVDVFGGLAVYPDRMRANLAATRGAIFAEKVVMERGPKHRDDPITPEQLASIRPEDYLGAAETLRRRLLEEE